MTERMQQAVTEYNGLRKLSKPALKQNVKQLFRVVDVSGASKDSLIMMIIEARFGRKIAEGLSDNL